MPYLHSVEHVGLVDVIILFFMTQRHKQSQEFNRYRTIDQFPPKEKKAPKDMVADLQFPESFLRYLYSGNCPRVKGIGKDVNTFIKRLEELGLLEKAQASEIRNNRSVIENFIHLNKIRLLCRL
ncbi:hypothetical protein BGZ58_010053 [Dissophora ornata]|nr:hypothetical protein BGZ58_010053 [Dissophora ornata]